MKKIKLTEKELYRIVETVLKEKENKYSKYDTVSDIADWSNTLSKVSGDDFKYVDDTKRYRVAVDRDNEYLAHWDHKLQKGFFDEYGLVPSDVLDSLGVVGDDKEYDYIDSNDMMDLSEGSKAKKKKSKNKLCARGKSAAKAKYDVYPSAYANGYAVQVCKGDMPDLSGNKKCSGTFCKGKK
jgi:hypothetical protein